MVDTQIIDVVEKAIIELQGRKGKATMTDLLAELVFFDAGDIGDAVELLINENKIKDIGNSNFVSITGKNVGDNMKVNQNNSQKVNGGRTNKEIELTPEQEDFRDHVCKNKGKIYDAQEQGTVLVHRGNQILFAGCGSQAFRYKIAVEGLSDKNPIEFPVLYLDWDDGALYDENGIADQLEPIIGKPRKTPAIQPTIQATVMGGK